MQKRLYRNRKDKILGGVLGGVGKYFKVDPTLIRLGFIAVIILFRNLFGGLLAAYIVAAIIVPEEPKELEGNKEDENKVEISKSSNNNLMMLGGVALIIFGSIKLLERILTKIDINLINYNYFWPALFILAGIYIIFVMGRKKNDE